MKKIILLLTLVFAALSANAFVGVCDSVPDENGRFHCPYITRGTITWDEATKTLTLDNAVVEYYTDDRYDGGRPISVTEDATIVIHGECKLITNGFSAMYFFSYSIKNISIIGDGKLYTSSTWIDIFLNCTHLTIKDIYLETVNGIANNGFGELCALTFDNVQADLKGSIERFGEGITFKEVGIFLPDILEVMDLLHHGKQSRMVFFHIIKGQHFIRNIERCDLFSDTAQHSVPSFCIAG